MIFIYALRCPVANAVRYIGKSNDPERRLKDHIRQASGAKRQHHMARWLRKLISANLRPEVEILCAVDDSKWPIAEREWIAKGRALGWPLTNTLSGGDGVEFISAEYRKQLYAAWHADPLNHAKYIAAMNAPERTAKISAAISKRNASDVKLHARVKADWADPQHKALRLAKMAATKGDPEWRKMFAAANKRAWDDLSKEARELRAARQRDPEVNAKRSASLRASWDRRRAVTNSGANP